MSGRVAALSEPPGRQPGRTPSRFVNYAGSPEDAWMFGYGSGRHSELRPDAASHYGGAYMRIPVCRPDDTPLFRDEFVTTRPAVPRQPVPESTAPVRSGGSSASPVGGSVDGLPAADSVLYPSFVVPGIRGCGALASPSVDVRVDRTLAPPSPGRFGYETPQQRDARESRAVFAALYGSGEGVHVRDTRATFAVVQDVRNVAVSPVRGESGDVHSVVAVIPDVAPVVDSVAGTSPSVACRGVDLGRVIVRGCVARDGGSSAVVVGGVESVGHSGHDPGGLSRGSVVAVSDSPASVDACRSAHEDSLRLAEGSAREGVVRAISDAVADDDPYGVSVHGVGCRGPGGCRAVFSRVVIGDEASVSSVRGDPVVAAVGDGVADDDPPGFRGEDGLLCRDDPVGIPLCEGVADDDPRDRQVFRRGGRRPIEVAARARVRRARERPEICPVCSAGFPYRSELTRHVLSKHRGEAHLHGFEGERHSCDHCEYVAIRSDHLLRHLRRKHGVVV